MISKSETILAGPVRTGFEVSEYESEHGTASEANRHARNSSRIIHVAKHCGYGNGNVHVAVDLACVQARAGYDVTFVSSGGTFVELLKQNKVRHLTLPHEQRRPWSMLRTAWRLSQLARKLEADVIHAHMMSSAVVGYIASRISGVPLVTTVHNSFDRHSILMRLGDMVVAVSEAERASLLRKGYAPNRLEAIMNAPDNSPREAFMDDGRELVIQSPCIVAANALHRRKGGLDLIEACTKLFKEFPEWKLYIAGEGPDRQKLEQQVHRNRMGDRMIFLGFLPAPRALLKKADIFVLASYADPCSLAIGEARTAGCAIVATHIGGTPEMLEFGRAGRLVAPGHPNQLAAALRDLMVDPQARSELHQAALRGSQVFDVQRLLGDYDRVYLQARRQRGTISALHLQARNSQDQTSTV